ncbi:hypothetical protein BVC80_8973g13 [Macleaya cordata]|uniref:Uncharacterized protein n=1 Tax=Macleaya cordata TaxID=56857 RepID=A0A200PMQ7_MACCD|nr:hypothetical protein BVC80_8973g13 [Macleaya cordata]
MDALDGAASLGWWGTVLELELGLLGPGLALESGLQGVALVLLEADSAQQGREVRGNRRNITGQSRSTKRSGTS